MVRNQLFLICIQSLRCACFWHVHMSLNRSTRKKWKLISLRVRVCVWREWKMDWQRANEQSEPDLIESNCIPFSSRLQLERRWTMDTFSRPMQSTANRSKNGLQFLLWIRFVKINLYEMSVHLLIFMIKMSVDIEKWKRRRLLLSGRSKKTLEHMSAQFIIYHQIVKIRDETLTVFFFCCCSLSRCVLRHCSPRHFNC